MRRNAALLVALTGASPVAAWLKHGFLSSGAEESWSPPRETRVADVEDDWTQAQVAMGWSPRPTEEPKPLFGRMLQPRLDEYTLGPKTCGFIESDSSEFEPESSRIVDLVIGSETGKLLTCRSFFARLFHMYHRWCDLYVLRRRDRLL